VKCTVEIELPRGGVIGAAFLVRPEWVGQSEGVYARVSHEVISHAHGIGYNAASARLAKVLGRDSLL